MKKYLKWIDQSLSTIFDIFTGQMFSIKNSISPAIFFDIFLAEQARASSAFQQKFCGLHVRNFQNKIPGLLRASQVLVFDFLGPKKWYNIGLSEGYIVANYKKNFPGGSPSVFALQTFPRFYQYTHSCVTEEANITQIQKFEQFIYKTERNIF